MKKLSKKTANNYRLSIPYLNKYRNDFGLDTCLRKTHFVSQFALESANFFTLEEAEGYSSSITLVVFSSSKIQINETIVESLKDNLWAIFKIVNEENGTGNIGFVVGRTKTGKLVILGGNQHDMVRLSVYSKDKFARFIYPEGRIPSYDIPLIENTDGLGSLDFNSTR